MPKESQSPNQNPQLPAKRPRRNSLTGKRRLTVRPQGEFGLERLAELAVTTEVMPADTETTGITIYGHGQVKDQRLGRLGREESPGNEEMRQREKPDIRKARKRTLLDERREEQRGIGGVIPIRE